MITARGWWYDGKSSGRREVVVTCSDDGSVRVEGDGVSLSAAVGDIRIDPPLGAARRMLRFPSGGIAEISENGFLDRLQQLQGRGGFFRAVHRWENSIGRTICALLLMAATIFCFFRYAVPELAQRAASALPPATEELMGRETLQILDRVVLKPSKLPEDRRRELTRLFSSIAVRHPDCSGWRLEFRSGDAVGANAFALPSGIIVLTDRLVEIAGNNDEIAAVLAHEVGHITRRHALRHLLQNSATALVVATVTGDITSITSLSATMPTLFIDAKYSRDFEREADDAAVLYLKEKKIPVRVYAEMLQRLEKDHAAKMNGRRTFGEWFSDHPATAERVKKVMGK